MAKPKADVFRPREFIAETVLPEVVDLPPGEWIPRLRELSRELPSDRRKLVLEESRRVLNMRRRVVAGVSAAVEEVRAMRDESGRPYGEVFKGVVLFGSITGRHYGVIHAGKALDPHTMEDLDVFPVVTYGSPKRIVRYPSLGKDIGYLESDDPLFGDVKDAPGRPQQGFLAIILDERIRQQTRIQGASHCSIRVSEGSPQATIDDILAIQEHYRNFRPLPWNFIGDEATGRLFAERLELMKRRG